jgi:hypothetical protein
MRPCEIRRRKGVQGHIRNKSTNVQGLVVASAFPVALSVRRGGLRARNARRPGGPQGNRA